MDIQQKTQAGFSFLRASSRARQDADKHTKFTPVNVLKSQVESLIGKALAPATQRANKRAWERLV